MNILKITILTIVSFFLILIVSDTIKSTLFNNTYCECTCITKDYNKNSSLCHCNSCFIENKIYLDKTSNNVTLYNIKDCLCLLNNINEDLYCLCENDQELFIDEIKLIKNSIIFNNIINKNGDFRCNKIFNNVINEIDCNNLKIISELLHIKSFIKILDKFLY
jgi:hypothetical protein